MKTIDPFEPTPAGFHLRVERKLNELQNQPQPVHVGRRLAVALAACLALLGGTALALEHWGVWHFLTQRVWMGEAVHASAIVEPLWQSCTSKQLDVSVRDAYWDGETLSIAMHIQSKGDYAFYIETDVGRDGKSFDQIWWNGAILPLEDWKAGRPELMLRLPRLMNDGENITAAWDWVQNEQGETMLIQGNCDDLTQGATLTVELDCTWVASGINEPSTLSFTLPPMTKGASNQ